MTESATLMVIDDDDDIREVLKILLEAYGYRVVTACDGLDAWRQLEIDEAPSLILLDLMMPRMDGEQFIEKLRQSPIANIPVVIMSGHTQAAGDGSIERTANEYLTKPIEIDDLISVVRRLAPNHPKQPAA